MRLVRDSEYFVLLCYFNDTLVLHFFHSITDLINRGLLEALYVLTLTSLPQVSDIPALSCIQVNL